MQNCIKVGDVHREKIIQKKLGMHIKHMYSEKKMKWLFYCKKKFMMHEVMSGKKCIKKLMLVILVCSS